MKTKQVRQYNQLIVLSMIFFILALLSLVFLFSNIFSVIFYVILVSFSIIFSILFAKYAKVRQRNQLIVLSIFFFILALLSLFILFSNIFSVIFYVILVSFSLLFAKYADEIKSYGDIHSYRILRKSYRFLKKSLMIKRRKCIFCGSSLQFSYFFWINTKKLPKNILEKWNSHDNSFYCSECYLTLNLEEELNTSYSGFYKINRYIG